MKINIENWRLDYNFDISQNYINGTITQSYDHIKNYGKLMENGVIFDIGSNLGFFSRVIADNLPFQELHLFEPCKLYYEEGMKLLSEFENVKHNNVAIGSEENFITLYKENPNSNPGWNTLLTKDPMQFDGFHNNLTPETVKMIRLDDHYNEIEKIDFMKIDVEGWERHVLEGAFNLIERFKPYLLIEVAWGYNHPEWGECKKIYNRLFDIGYKSVEFVNHTQDVLFEPK